jgi:hypothetical protein
MTGKEMALINLPRNFLSAIQIAAVVAYWIN